MVMAMMVVVVVVVRGISGLLMLEDGRRWFWPGSQAVIIVANAIIRKTRATGRIYKK